MPEYSKEQIWKIYEKLPGELKDAIFSQESAEDINNVCEKNKITKPEQISEIARLTGDVLLGLLMPDEFQETLEKELKLKKPIAKKIAFQIQRFVFYPVRKSLSELYQTDIQPPTEMPSEKVKTKSKTKPSGKKDVYRELVE